jgi:hypothetical protein
MMLGWEYSTYVRGFWWKIQKERDHWEHLDKGERIILKWILEK